MNYFILLSSTLEPETSVWWYILPTSGFALLLCYFRFTLLSVEEKKIDPVCTEPPMHPFFAL